MNIGLQLCGLAVLILIFFFFILQKKLGLYGEKFFFLILVITIISTLFDIFSTGLAPILPDRVENYISKGYLIFQTYVPYFAMLYSLYSFRGRAAYRDRTVVYQLVATVVFITILASPIDFYIGNGVFYTYGLSVQLAYIYASLFVANIIVITIRQKNAVNKKRYIAVCIWMLIWIIAAAIQYIFPQYLLLSFSCSLGVLILFTAIENPESTVDKASGLFNGQSLREYMRELYEEDVKFSLLEIIADDKNTNLDNNTENALLVEITEFFRTLENTTVFRNVGLDFVIIFRKKLDISSMAQIVEERFKSPWLALGDDKKTNTLDCKILTMDKTYAINSFEEYSVLSKYVTINTSFGKTVNLNTYALVEYKSREDAIAIVKDALENDRVLIYLQPIYSIKEKKFTTAEALVRILDEKGSIVPPIRFIPYIENMDLINSLGERVFEKTCKFIKKYDITAYGLTFVAVNLSITQCEDETLVKKFDNIVKEQGIDHNKISFEVTESMPVKYMPLLRRNMVKFRYMGMQFALDDFGNGESNLNYIVNMPLSSVKLDMQMTQAYLEDEKTKIVVDSVVDMIKKLNMKIIAEGVETKQQLEAMEKAGVDYIQGYIFSKPLPTEEFIKFLKKYNNIED